MPPGGKHRGKGRRHDGAQVQNVLSSAGAPPGTFPVIDPLSRKLFVPLEFMMDTRAMHREGVPSLCRIFMQGRCRQGANCFQAHAEPNEIARLRAAALEEPSCCPAHGAPNHGAGLPQNLQVVITSDGGRPVGQLQLDRVCVTNGLHKLIVAQGVGVSPVPLEVAVPASSLCRLHRGGDGSSCCRFDHECNFVHICRELSKGIEDRCAAEEASTPAPAAEKQAPAPVSETPSPAIPEIDVRVRTRQGGGPAMCSSVTVPMSASVGYAGTPPLNFDPLALAATAPIGGEPAPTFPLGMSPVRSFSSTPNGLVWRHNPYGSSKTSSVIET